jgi:hypothetical protein
VGPSVRRDPTDIRADAVVADAMDVWADWADVDADLRCLDSFAAPPFAVELGLDMELPVDVADVFHIWRVAGLLDAATVQAVRELLRPRDAQEVPRQALQVEGVRQLAFPVRRQVAGPHECPGVGRHRAAVGPRCGQVVAGVQRGEQVAVERGR